MQCGGSHPATHPPGTVDVRGCRPAVRRELCVAKAWHMDVPAQQTLTCLAPSAASRRQQSAAAASARMACSFMHPKVLTCRSSQAADSQFAAPECHIIQ
jgi:hypothetical protein